MIVNKQDSPHATSYKNSSLVEATVTGGPRRGAQIPSCPLVSIQTRKDVFSRRIILTSALHVLLFSAPSSVLLSGRRQIQSRNIRGFHRLIECWYVRRNKLLPCIELLVKLATQATSKRHIAV